MDSHPDIAVCGTWTKTIGKIEGYINRYFTNPEDIGANLLFYTSLSHPSVMIRKSVLDTHELKYGIDLDRDENSEDYALWVKISQVGKLANVPKVLLLFRMHDSNVTRIFRDKNRESASFIRKRQLERLGLTPSTEEMLLHNSVMVPRDKNTEEFLTRQEEWLSKIKEANNRHPIYSIVSLDTILRNRWYSICLANAPGNTNMWLIYRRSSLSQVISMRSAKIFLRSLCKRKSHQTKTGV